MNGNAMKMTTIRRVPMPGSVSPKSVLALAAAALAVMAASEAGAASFSMPRTSSVSLASAAEPSATTIYSDGFESYTANASLTTAAGGSWSRDGSGSATVTQTSGLPETGIAAALFAPASTTAGSWVYRSSTALSNIATSANPIVTSSASLAITSPATGTASRSVVLGLQTYDSAVNNLGSALLIWDGLNTYGFGTSHLVLQFDFGDGSADFGYDFGAYTSAQLSTSGYFNVSIALNYQTGDIAFSWGNSTLGYAFATEATHGSFDAGVSTDFSDADFYYARGSTGGTLPRLLGDNYSITTSAAAPVPEPETWALMLGGLGMVGMLARRRRAE
jgi:hypothetical protein